MRPMATGRKTRLIFVGASASLLAIPATAAALTVGPLSSRSGVAKAASSSARRAVTVKHRSTDTAARRGCKKLFTVKMGERAANAIYSGHGKVSEHSLEVLGYIERCQRNPAAEGFVREYDHSQARTHDVRMATARAASASPAGGSGGWAIPSSVVQCESGGQDLGPNSAGASGYYQIIPSTWAAYGGTQYAGAAFEASAAQQAVVASRIWAGGSGASQWVCAGG
jgi:hypothetical protein